MEDNGSLTRVAAFPIGIDPERFAAALEEDSVRASIAQLLNKYAGRKVRPPSIYCNDVGLAGHDQGHFAGAAGS